MENLQTNFDRYLERKLQNADFRTRFAAADQAWDIALQLADLRRARGLTQQQVAELIGTKQQAIARLEDPTYAGHSLSMVRKYVEALGAIVRVTIEPTEVIGAYAVPRSPRPLHVHEKQGNYDVSSDQTQALLRVVTDYARSLDILDDYDHQRTRPLDVRRGAACGIDYDEAIAIVAQLRQTFGGTELFGREKDASLRSSLAAVMQSFDGADVYPGLEEKAAHLLYFLVKNHSFVDGNKRIGAALFLWFMEKNGILYRTDGSKRIADNALVAITLMIAESAADQREILTRIVVELINDRN
jgi:prophage maintenance system killer protein/DNA-binding XRE family transcriptional regulator